jgi:RNA polymerase primary sigma factor
MSKLITSLYDLPILSHQEELALYERIKTGDEKAVDTLVQANLRLVIYVVKNLPFWNRNESGLTYEDLIQIGNMYLLKAAREWKPMGKIRFASFARRVIESWVKREHEKFNKTIHVPSNKQEKIRLIQYIESTMENPSVKEVAKKAKMSEAKVRELKEIMNREPVSLDGLQTDNNVGEHYEN